MAPFAILLEVMIQGLTSFWDSSCWMERVSASSQRWRVLAAAAALFMLEVGGGRRGEQGPSTVMLSRTVLVSGWQKRVPVMLWLWVGGQEAAPPPPPGLTRHPCRWNSVKSMISTLRETRFPFDL